MPVNENTEAHLYQIQNVLQRTVFGAQFKLYRWRLHIFGTFLQIILMLQPFYNQMFSLIVFFFLKLNSSIFGHTILIWLYRQNDFSFHIFRTMFFLGNILFLSNLNNFFFALLEICFRKNLLTYANTISTIPHHIEQKVKSKYGTIFF